MYNIEQINKEKYSVTAVSIGGFVDEGEVINIIADEQLTIYGDEVAEVPIVNTLMVNYTCDVGQESGNDYILNVSETGEYWLNIYATNDGNEVRKTKSRLIVSDKVTGDKELSDADFYDWPSKDPPLYNWDKHADNTFAIVETDKIEITYVNGSSGGWIYLTADKGLSEDLIDGADYTVLAQAKYAGGDGANIRVFDGVASQDITPLTTGFVEYELNFTKDPTSDAYLTFSSMGPGETIIVGYVKVFKDNRTITLIGNSLINSGGDDELVAIRGIFSDMTWLGIGLTGLAPNLREGYSGKTYDWLVNHADSPFTKDGVVDIPDYYTDNGLNDPDFIYMRMGVNDAFSFLSAGFTEAQQTTWISNINTLIDAFLAHNINYEIIICIPSISENTGAGWENSYGPDPGNVEQNEYIRIIHVMWDLIIENYVDYDARVTVAYAPWFLDRDDGYPKTDGVHTNGVHPNADGYAELGKGLAAHLNYLL